VIFANADSKELNPSRPPTVPALPHSALVNVVAMATVDMEVIVASAASEVMASFLS
jgi:hypothetical protein